MNLLSKLPQGLTRRVGKLWLKTKQTNPEICVIGGIVCGAGALVLVGVKTWQNKEELEQDWRKVKFLKATAYTKLDEEHKEEIEVEQQGTGRKTKVKCPTIAKKEPTKEELDNLWKGRLAFAIDIGKTYWMPLTLEVVSGCLIWKGRSILRRDLSTMTAAYAAIAKAYQEYRKKVAEKIGAEEEQKLAYGYSTEEVVDENGKVERHIKPEANGNRNPYGFWVNEGIMSEDGSKFYWRNPVWKRDKRHMQYKVKELQDDANFDLITKGYWRLESSMIKFGIDPKEAAKFHDFGMVARKGSDQKVEFRVLDGPNQLPCNKGFTDNYCSQDIFYVDPMNVEYIGYINADLEKYDRRYSYNAPSEMPYKSYVREANRLIERYNTEKMEQKIFTGMSDAAQRKWAKILK